MEVERNDMNPSNEDRHAALSEDQKRRILVSVDLLMGMVKQAISNGQIKDAKELFWHFEQGGIIYWASQLLADVDMILIRPSSEQLRGGADLVQVYDFIYFMELLANGSSQQIDRILFTQTRNK